MMNLTEAQFDTIERYLGQALSDEERQRFEAEIAHNQALNAEVQRQRTLREALSSLAALERFRRMHGKLKGQGLLTMEVEVDPSAIKEVSEVPDRPQRPESDFSSPPVREVVPLQPGTSQKSPFIKYLVAATITGLTLGGAFYFLLRTPDEPAPDTLYKSFYHPDSTATPLPPRLNWQDRQGRELENPAYRQTLEAAVRAYRQGQYQQSERLIRRLPERGGSSVFFQDYYLGVGYLETGDIKRALRYLKAASRAPQTPPRHQAEWYLALGYLKANQVVSAQQTLQNISQTPGHPYQDRARDLLSKL